MKSLSWDTILTRAYKMSILPRMAELWIGKLDVWICLWIGMAINNFVHSALKLEKSAISKVQKSIICIFKNGKKSIFAPEKSLKLPKILFFQSKNCIFGNFKLFSGAKIDFLPFLKMQIMFFYTFEIALFSNFRALWGAQTTLVKICQEP